MNYKESCDYSIRLIEKLKSLDTKNILDFDLINKAIYWAKKYHGEQKRKSGELYYTHPLEVAYMVSDYKLKTDVIAASILHDIIEDTEVTAGMILDNFSWRIAKMVDGLTRDRLDGSKLSVLEIITNAYQSKDKEILLIKIFDKLHNLQNINCLTIDKQIATAQEALNSVLVASTYLGNINIEYTIGSIINRILKHKVKSELLNYKINNSLIDGIHQKRFVHLFES